MWETDNFDKFLIDNNKILFWKCESEAVFFAKKNDIAYEKHGQILFDLEECEKWCCSSSSDFDCKKVLDIWNIFSDFCNSIEEKFIGNDNEFDEIYDKIFCGNNLPEINKTGKLYIPIFSGEEVLRIKNILLNGLCCFRKVVSDNY